MCAGYMPGTAPEVCNPNGCDNGIARDACGVCGGSATDDSNCEAKSKFPTGAVIGVIILCCVLIGGGTYEHCRTARLFSTAADAAGTKRSPTATSNQACARCLRVVQDSVLTVAA
jgi:hypothetical protein